MGKQELSVKKSKKSVPQFNILNASVRMIEIGWQEVEFTIKKEKFVIEFETGEFAKMGCDNVFTVEFNSKKDEKLAKKIGFEITDEFVKEMQAKWSMYSVNNFR